MSRIGAALCAIVLITGCSLVRHKDLHVRPVIIQVVDHETERPLAGIPVIYSLDKYQVTILPAPLSLIYMESPYYDDDSLIDVGLLLTDTNGEISVPARHFRFNERTHIGHEIYLINLDRKDRDDLGATLDEQVLGMLKHEMPFIDPEMYYTPDAVHRGFYVEIMNFDVDTRSFGLPDTTLSDSRFLDRQSFQKPEERIRIMLRRMNGRDREQVGENR